ncbi:hypothetical protein [Streptomyces sp. V4I8]|uniref:hypothetical protein n=1 Tax=Streptomyces sp. V4I8 TaxID=3156469 RepID=UPI00351473C5
MYFDKVLKVFRTPAVGWQRRTVQRPVTSGELLRSEEILQQFAEWLDLRSERLMREMTPGPWELASLYADKVRGPLERLLRERGFLHVERQQVDVQISAWEVPAFERRYFEADVGRLVEPEPGSAHEEYERLIRQVEIHESDGDTESASRILSIAEQIRQGNLVTVTDTAETYILPKDIAFHFLSLCANRLAQLGKRDIVTDRQEFTDVALYSDAGLRGDVASAVLQAYLPKNLATADPAQIADCRERLSSERLRFQAGVQSLVTEFTEVSSVDSYQTLKRQLAEIANERIDATKRAYRKAKLDVTQQALTISLTPPALAAAAASALHIGVLAPASVLTTLSLFAASGVIDWRSAQTGHAQSPWSYVLSMPKKF